MRYVARDPYYKHALVMMVYALAVMVIVFLRPWQGEAGLANVGDLMLRLDVVEACDRGEFSVYGVDHIREAIALLLDREAGELDAQGCYPEGTVLGVAMQRARTLYDQVRRAD